MYIYEIEEYDETYVSLNTNLDVGSLFRNIVFPFISKVKIDI